MYWNRRAALVTLLLSTLTTGTSLAQDKATLPPPTDRSPRASVTLADYRYDDLMWENDKTAHRIYGHALEAAEPPSGSGIDSWGKKVVWP